MDCFDIMDNQAWNWQGRSFKIDELVFLGINILLQSCATLFCYMFCDIIVVQSSEVPVETSWQFDGRNEPEQPEIYTSDYFTGWNLRPDFCICQA